MVNQHAGRAVDGDSNAKYGYPEVSCSSTYTWDPLITHAWWMVDLQKDYQIESITIQNREDCCGKRNSFPYVLYINKQVTQLGFSEQGDARPRY